MIPNPINLEQKFKLFSDHWSPKIIAQMNDYHFKLAKIKGEFIWHQHDETDETFIMIDGTMQILFRNGVVQLSKGEICVVPKGVEHKPVADEECHIMMIEIAGTINTGDRISPKTHDNLDWV